jgi:hypothetical protein
VVSFNVTAQKEFSIYFMGSTDYQRWHAAGQCSPGGVSDFSGGFGVTSYVHDIVVSKDDVYHVVLLNFSHDSPVEIQFGVQITGTATASEVTTRTAHTQTQITLLQLLITTTMVQTSLRMEQVLFGIPFFMFLVIVGIVVLGVVGVLAFALISRKRSRR